MRTLVLGAGATGGYYGARLLEAGEDVTFLVRSGRAKKLKVNGLNVKSKFGDFSSKAVNLVEKVDGEYDLIILTCKAWDLEPSLEAVAPAVGNNTAILPLLNGMAHLQKLQDRFGSEHVLGGLCIISSTLADDGTILHLNDTHAIKYGELSKEKSERIAKIDAAFKKANCGSKLSEDISKDMWEKWVMIASLAAITTLMRATVGEVARAPGGRQIARAIFEECLGVAKKHRTDISDEFIKSASERLVDPESTLAASMLRDLQSGNRIEADQIIGDLIEAGRKQQVDTANLEIVYCNLKVYEAAQVKETVKAAV
ncbi:MAG TPA: 2-dehydropantoate 2-reductase [Planktothrix sp.]